LNSNRDSGRTGECGHILPKKKKGGLSRKIKKDNRMFYKIT